MTIDYKIYDTDTLLGVMKEFTPPTTYWLDLAFGGRLVESAEENIDFEKIYTQRKIAPLVSPFAQGRPIFTEASEATRFKPAYIKVKDPVTAARAIKKRPGQIFSTAPNDPMARYNAIVADILGEHYDAIVRRWEWLAARAVIDAAVVLNDEASGARHIDFRRAPSNTVALTGGARWGQAGVSIVKDIESWLSLVRKPVDGSGAKFGLTGGKIDRLTVTPSVWDVMRANDELMKQLDLMTRGTAADFNTGIREMSGVEYVGKIAQNLPVYVYSETYKDPITGAETDYMTDGDIVLTGPGIEGVRAFGAILDKRAGIKPMATFPKMWDEEDPSATQVMTQSAPLMVPLNPNASFKATVL